MNSACFSMTYPLSNLQKKIKPELANQKVLITIFIYIEFQLQNLQPFKFNHKSRTVITFINKKNTNKINKFFYLMSRLIHFIIFHVSDGCNL